MTQRHAIIVGAGLAGSLLAVSLARDGWRVSVYERRPDPRRKGVIGGRSINLAVSARGIAGLASVGLDKEILAGHAIPMPGRMIHPKDGPGVYQPYSKNPGDAINSFSRGGLNLALINAAAREPNVTLFFDHPCVDVDFDSPAAFFSAAQGSPTRVTADLIIAADGAYSAVRQAMQKTDRFEFSQSYLGHGYKELSIPPSPTHPGGFALQAGALHIWPRGGAMMIALPNTDGSFTNTLFWPWEGEHSFANLEGPWREARRKNPAASPAPEDRCRVQEFFEQQYPDATPIMPTLVDDFFNNPTSSLVTVRCWPWQRGGRVALLGDAAHAIVPFYGQGMNAAFEDVVCLAGMLRQHADIPQALDAYQAQRKPSADAIADMALSNFVEMRDKVGSPAFRYRKKVEQAIHEMFEDRVTPQYNLVSFTTVPYVEARRRGAELDAVLDRVVRAIQPETALPEPAWRERVRVEAARALGVMVSSQVAGSTVESSTIPASCTVRTGLIDLSPLVSERLKVWPGDTPPSREIICDMHKGANITLSTLHATVHLGSHADGANHYGLDAPSIDQMPLERYIGPCQVLRVAAVRGTRITPAQVEGLDDIRTPIVLLKSGTFPDPESWNEDFAALSIELVDAFASRGVTTIGVDTPSVDLFSSKDLEAHRAILRHGIAILEGLRLTDVEAGPQIIYELIAPPLRLEGFDGSPVRAVLRRLQA